MLEEQQKKTYENLRLHFTGLAFQGLNADPELASNSACAGLAIERGKLMTAAWVDTV
jgi:hypothetical protein